MSSGLNRLLAYAVALAAILAVLAFGVRQYGNSRVAAQELGTVKEAVQGAVRERKAAVKVDALQAKDNAAKRDAVRLVVRKAQDESKEIPRDCTGDAERIRLLNDAIRRVNAVLATTGNMPE